MLPPPVDWPGLPPNELRPAREGRAAEPPRELFAKGELFRTCGEPNCKNAGLGRRVSWPTAIGRSVRDGRDGFAPATRNLGHVGEAAFESPSACGFIRAIASALDWH